MNLNDKVSKPSNGRFFPFCYKDIVHLMEEQQFSVPSYYKRLPLYLENCNYECELGFQLASFNRWGYLAVFSLPERETEKTAQLALKRAIVEFGRIDKKPHPAVRDQQIIMHRAYLKAPATLTITRHIVNAGNRSYLVYKKVAQLSKSKNKTTQEHILTRITLI